MRGGANRGAALPSLLFQPLTKTSLPELLATTRGWGARWEAGRVLGSWKHAFICAPQMLPCQIATFPQPFDLRASVCQTK